MSHRRSEPTGSLHLAGRVVGAAGQGVAGARVWIDSLPVHTVTSDRDGMFELDSLITRSYEVRAQAGDLIGGPRVIRLTVHTAPIVIELTEGSHVMVTVVDTTRAPIANASVRVVGSDAAATTDAAGNTRITTHPGHIALEATGRGYAPRRASVAAASSGTTARATIVLREGFEVRGRVFDQARTPIPNVRVYALEPSVAFTDEEQATTVTDEAGAFTIPSTIGMHRFLAIDDEHAPTKSATLDIDRAISDLEIVMKAGGVYAGYVVDADRKPVAQARVYLDAVSVPGPRRFSASSDAHGAFEIRGLPETIGRTDADDVAAVAYAASDDGVSDDVLVRFAKQRELRGQELALRRRDTTGVIAGVVVDDTGAPVANVLINAAARPSFPFPDAILRSRVWPSHLDPSTATSTRANARGEFSIPGLPTGEHAVWTGAFNQHTFSGLAIRFLGGEDVSPFITSAHVGDTAVRLVMPRAGRITGNVAFADSGELVDDFEVDVFGRNEIATGVPGEHGAFDLRDLRPGSYRLQIRAPVFSTTMTAAVAVDAGQSIDLGTITLDRGRTLTGSVVDSTGRGIAGANVMVGEYGVFQRIGRFDVPTFAPSSAVTDANGAFAIVGGAPIKPVTPSWRVVVGADHPSYGRALPVAIPVGTQDPPPVTLTLLECGSISGTLTRNGQPIYSASIGAGWPGFGTAMVNEDGEFLISRLPAGPVALRIQVFADESHRAHQTTVHVEAGKQIEVALEVPAGTIKLSVIVAPRPGADVAGAQLHLFSGMVAFENYAELNSQFLIGMQGRADWESGANHPAFERLVPGDYTVCTMPLPGSPNDQKLMQRVYSDRASVKVYCTPVRVVAAPAEQTVTVDVPAMVWAESPSEPR